MTENGYLPILELISTFVKLSETDLVRITTAFEIVHVKKNTKLEQANKPARYLYFINSGFVRIFYMVDGEDRTIQINCPSRFITSYQSFITDKKACDNVEAITDCVLLRITKDELSALGNIVANWYLFEKSIYKQTLVFNEERNHDMLLLSAEDRYLKLIESRPDIVKNVPLKYIASFIGIKAESLSRIRRQLIS